MRQAKTSSLNQTVWIITLILSLLFAQFAGLQHRVDHAGLLGSQSFGKPALQLSSAFDAEFRTDGSTKTINHSCAAFDAATLADTFDASACTPLFAPNANSTPPSFAFASWDAAVIHQFLSRAPPVLII